MMPKIGILANFLAFSSKPFKVGDGGGGACVCRGVGFLMVLGFFFNVI